MRKEIGLMNFCKSDVSQKSGFFFSCRSVPMGREGALHRQDVNR